MRYVLKVKSHTNVSFTVQGQSLALRSSNSSNALSDKDRRCGRVIIPAKLQRRSTGAEDGKTALFCTKSGKASLPTFPNLIQKLNCNT